MKSRTAKSRTADLFAAATECHPTDLRDTSRTPAPTPAHIPALALVAAGQPHLKRPHLNRPHSKQLWYAAVFPELTQADTGALQKLCMQAQTFTSFVSVESPSALLLEM